MSQRYSAQQAFTNAACIYDNKKHQWVKRGYNAIYFTTIKEARAFAKKLNEEKAEIDEYGNLKEEKQ